MRRVQTLAMIMAWNGMMSKQAIENERDFAMIWVETQQVASSK
jgi:hypothetical protein